MDEFFETLRFPGLYDEVQALPRQAGAGGRKPRKVQQAATAGGPNCRPAPPTPSLVAPPADPTRAALLSKVAAAVQTVVNGMRPRPAGTPGYAYLGTLEEMPALLDSTRPPYCGLYLIVFPSGVVAGAKPSAKAYSGQSNDLRSRLMEHRLCSKIFNLPTARYVVYVWHLPNSTNSERRALELAFHGAMGIGPLSVLSNQRHELEPGLWEAGAERFAR